MAEALLRRHLERAGVDATVSSAGLHPAGSPATAHGVATMAARGLDLSEHRSRTLEAALVARADLIVAMARDHAREALVLAPDALARTYTLKELVHAGERAGRRRVGEDLRAWLGRIGASRPAGSLVGIGHDPTMDVDDPIGRGRADYEATADELDDLLGRLVTLAWPVHDAEHVS